MKKMALLLALVMIIGVLPTMAFGEDYVTLTYYNMDGTNNVWLDNPVGKAIADATGVILDSTYPVASTGDGGEDVAMMIAEGEYPDLIYAKGEATNLYEAGAYIDMRPLIEEYGPNIKKMYGDEFEKLAWSQEDNGIYQLCAYGVRGQTLTTGGSVQIQYAAIKDNGYQYPKTIEEFEKCIKDYLAAHPKTDDGLDMIGITMSAPDWHWMITLGNPAGFVADASDDHGQWVVDDDNNVIYKHTTEEEKEYFRWVNRMFNEGILDNNFATQTDEDYMAKVASGRVVALTDAWWHYSQAVSVLKADGKLAQTYFPLPVTLRADQKCPILRYQGLQVGWGIGITKSCKYPVKAIQFLDFICSDEGQMLFNWGIEGVNYEMVDGKPVRSAEEIAKANSDPDYAKKTGIENYPGFPRYGEGAVDENGISYTRYTKESVVAEYDEQQKEACAALGIEALTDIFPQPDEFELRPFSPIWAYQKPQELQDMETVLNDIAQKQLVKCVMCSEADFDATWDAFQKDLADNGVEECQKQYTEWLATKIM